MASEHRHSEQLFVRELRDAHTNVTTLESYCLICGERVYKVELKDMFVGVE